MNLEKPLRVAGRLNCRASDFVAAPHRLFIANQWCDSCGGRTIDVIDPVTGEKIADIADAGVEDVDRAVAAAKLAFEAGAWPAMSGAARGKLLWRLADLLLENADEIAVIETIDSGKPLRDTRAVDLNVASEMLRYYAGWATKLKGESVSIGDPGDYHAYTVREPIGVVAQIIPWNFPLLMAILKIAPALAAGCTLVLKPAEETSLSALRLGELIVEAGFPAGVVNIVTGVGEIAGSLITGIRSDLPGLVTAQVTENVFDSATGRILLLPQGARLIGKYDSVVAYGQKRALVVWQRIVLPDGSSLGLDNVPASDASGYSGLADKVDGHSWALLKGVVISTLLGVGSELQLSGQSGLVQAIRQSGQQNVAHAGDQLTSKTINIQPTITIRPGTPVRLVVQKDLILAPWRG